MSAYRVYAPDELGSDGYPPVWHERLKHDVRAAAGNRCVRCGHPYRNGEHGSGEWSRCDEGCVHCGPARYRELDGHCTILELGDEAGRIIHDGLRKDIVLEAQWRILTVHHLTGDKADCRWFNLVALCQRCHLVVQGKVVMHRAWPWEHSTWMKPYVAAFYALKYRDEDLTRSEVNVRLDELLSLGQQEEAMERMPL